MSTVAELLYAGRALTERELDVLQGAANGETAEQTAARLFLAPATVKSHKKHVQGKLMARNGPHAVAIALRRGFIT